MTCLRSSQQLKLRRSNSERGEVVLSLCRLAICFCVAIDLTAISARRESYRILLFVEGLEQAADPASTPSLPVVAVVLTK